MPPVLGRLAAILAIGCTLAGTGLVAYCVTATRRLWFDGYVSEAGVGAEASGYLLGILGIGAGLVLAGGAVVRFLPLAAGLLAGAGLFAGVSGSVPCSAGCPLPPYETATTADLVHAGASILAVGTVALAMIALALAPAVDALVRRVSRLAGYVIVPLIAAAGFAILGLGRGPLTGLLERTVLVLATLWTVVVCARAARP
jgi:hypothetical protein